MKTLHLKTYAILCCFILMVAFTSCSKDDVSEEDVELSETLSMVDEILQIVNAHRASIGKVPLEFNTLANDLAYEHTLYMIEQRDISHDDFDKRSDRLFAEANASRTGENVAYGQRNAEAVMEAWLNSSGHRRNIEGDFTHIGIAVVKNGNGTYYYTQLFFKKRNANT
ncbi:CAP domain-containing protein [Hyunsoonleella sp. SJ7]|uniref:CAP domain-containing protein n=1 Tax=Hyunsoonleella aquatilis TaxID=2762758 RepID=A0A923KLT6_9FLAO|nr:CAP domain-containing protein [Hyunsoonleella aquatilis]MBC3759802.1 CAP domain-containing protein [Hyunsoonleella aquatilis]